MGTGNPGFPVELGARVAAYQRQMTQYFVPEVGGPVVSGHLSLVL